MEKAFALKETHFPTNNIAIYSTLDRRVEYVIFLKKAEWPNRGKEEVFRCAKCKGFILPKEQKIKWGDWLLHKGTCRLTIKEEPTDKEAKDAGATVEPSV